MVTDTRKTAPFRSLLQNRGFIALWLGQAVSSIGDYFYFLAIPIMVNKLTGSELMVGLSAISSALPVLILGPVAGVFVDRWNRKTTMIISDLLRGLLVLPTLLVQTADQVWIYYLAGFLLSCVSRFFYPAQNALLPSIVKDENDLLSANGLMQAVMTASLLVGPALAGITIGIWGAWVAFTFDSLSFFFSAVMILTITASQANRQVTPKILDAHPIRSVYLELREGLTFLFKSPILAPMMVCFMIAHLSIGAVNVIWVPFMQRVFQVGAEGLGILDSAQGVGMLIGGLSLGFISARIKKIPLVAICLSAMGLFFVGTGLAPTFLFVIAMCLGMGLALMPVQSVLVTIMQVAVPDDKRGRVSGAVNALGTAAGLISMAVAAAIGDQIGLHNVYVVCGLICICSGILTFFIGREPLPTPQTTTG